MKPLAAPRTPVGYRIRVAGRLDERRADYFAGHTLNREPDGTTVIDGAMDQAQLHGLLARIGDLGIVLIAVEPSWPDGCG